MSSKKSLGSSPIGFSDLSRNSYQFIRDLGVSKKNNQGSDNDIARDDGPGFRAAGQSIERRTVRDSVSYNKKNRPEPPPIEKKIVSYYLEIDLVKKLKLLADNEGEYYSTVVNKALRFWLDHKGV